MNSQIKSEIEFLRTYYKFYVERNGSDKGFSENVMNTLVKTGQISQESLDYFIKIITLENEISSKNKEILELKKRIEELSGILRNLTDTSGPTRPIRMTC